MFHYPDEVPQIPGIEGFNEESIISMLSKYLSIGQVVNSNPEWEIGSLRSFRRMK
jgi:hypothetical protein